MKNSIQIFARFASLGIFLQFLALCSSLMSVTSVWASEQDIAPDEPQKPIAMPHTPVVTTSDFAFDIAFGVSLTTDYISRGITNSNSHPAVQGYIEPSIELPNIGTAYINVWSSNVDYGEGFKGAEIDVAGGIRPQFGKLSLDLGYVHYFYSPEHVSPDYGELFAKADYNFDDLFTVGSRVFFAPDYNQSGKTATWVAAGVTVPLPHDFKVYGGLGYQFFEDPDAFEQLAWTAGVSYKWENVTFDLRYWGTNLAGNECAVRSGFSDGCNDRVVATISFDTSFKEVRDWMSGK